MEINTSYKKISIFTLIMITVIATDSLRSIPISAQYGYHLLFYYFLAAITFMLPSALITAELVSTWPQEGGVYLWVSKAFGTKIGFFTIWMQWVYNICWYPTILAFLAATLAYIINPSLSDNKLYTFFTIIITYWLITWISSKGIGASSKLSISTAILGTIFPMLLITVLGLIWLLQGNRPVIEFTNTNFIPNMGNTDNWILFSNILYSILGVENSAYHIRHVKNPQRNYPIALLGASVIILLSLILSSLAVALLIPQEVLKNNLVDGLLNAFLLFFSYFNMQFIMPLISAFIILGIIGGVGAWIIGPSKGLQLAAEEIKMPKILQKKNSEHTPTGILFVQGVIVTILAFIYILMPSVNSAFFILSILTAQLAIISYLTLFAAFIRLRYKYPDIKRPFKVPGNNIGSWILGGLGIASCVITVTLSFLPPKGIDVGNIYLYEFYLISGFLIFILSPFLVIYCNKFNRTIKN